MSTLMERLESDMARIFRGPEFYPLGSNVSPTPLAPLDSLPERAPVAAFSEEVE